MNSYTQTVSVITLPDPQSVRPLGKHLVCLDGDVTCFVFHGTIDLPEMVEIMALADAQYERYGYCLVLADSKDVSAPTAAARRYQNERHREVVHPSHTALYGANAFIRSLLVLSQRATELVTGKQWPVSVHKNEAEARECLQFKRALLAADKLVTSSPKTG
jgi:hypothetical protein